MPTSAPASPIPTSPIFCSSSRPTARSITSGSPTRPPTRSTEIVTPDALTAIRKIAAGLPVENLAGVSSIYLDTPSVPMMIAIQHLAPVSKAEEVKNTDLPVIVFGQYLGKQRLHDLGRSFLIDDLEFARACCAPGGSRVPIQDITGKDLGVVAWTPPTPGNALLRSALLPIGVALTLFCVVALATAFRARKMAIALTEERARGGHRGAHRFHDPPDEPRRLHRVAGIGLPCRRPAATASWRSSISTSTASRRSTIPSAITAATRWCGRWRRASAASCRRAGDARPHRRRRVRRRAHRRQHRRRPPPAPPPRRRARSTSPSPSAASSSTSPPRSATPSPMATARAGRTRAPRRPRHVPRQERRRARGDRLSPDDGDRRAGDASSSNRRSAAPSRTATSSRSSTSRWCAPRTCRSSASRRWCAGIRPSSARSRRPCSFRSPRRPA